MNSHTRRPRAIAVIDLIADFLIPVMLVGWGLAVWHWLPAWLGGCGLCYFALRALIGPRRNWSVRRTWSLLPGMACVCGAGVFAGMGLTELRNEALGATWLAGLLFTLAVPLALGGAALLVPRIGRRWGLADDPVIVFEPYEPESGHFMG